MHVNVDPQYNGQTLAIPSAVPLPPRPVIADTLATVMREVAELLSLSIPSFFQLSSKLNEMLDALRRRSASYNASNPPPHPSAAEAALAALPQSKIRPYEVPLADGRCYLSELPSEILTRIFLKLDRASLTKSYRVSQSHAGNKEVRANSSYVKTSTSS